RLSVGVAGNPRRFVGSAFFIDPNYLLTAAHCVNEAKHGESFFIEPFAGHGERCVEVVDRHPQRDVALLRVVDPRQRSEAWIPVPRSTATPEPGAAVTVWGFSPNVARPDPRATRIIEPSEEYDAIRLDQNIAKGMSGGPVVDESGMLVGVLHGKSIDSACQYVVPVSAFEPWPDQKIALSRHPHLPAWLKGYLDNLIRKLEDMPTDVMLRRLGGNSASQHLKTRALYVPLHVPFSWGEFFRSDAGKLGSRDSDKPVPLLEVLALQKRLVVRGDPGCGKSTFLRYVALRLAGRLKGESRQPDEHDEALPEALERTLPLFVELKTFYRCLNKTDTPIADVPSAADVETAMRACLNEGYRELREGSDRLAALLASQPESGLNPLWLLDGLDEINLPDESRHLLIRGLEKWARDLPPTHRVCLTTRPYAYMGQPLRDFDNRLVNALEDKEIVAFVRRFCRHNGSLFRPGATAAELDEIAKELITVLEAPERDALRRIAGNPLLLTLTTAMFCKEGETALPRDRAELYRICLEALLTRWEEKLDYPDATKVYSIHDATLSEADLNAALDQIGFQAHLGLTQAGAAAQDSGDLPQALIEHAFSSRLGQGYSAAHVVDYLRNKTGLLLARDDGKFAFIHRSFREFLAARYLTLTDSIRDLNQVRDATRKDPGWWREVLALAARLGDRCGGVMTVTDWLTYLLRFDAQDHDTDFGDVTYWLSAEAIANAEAERDVDPINLDRKGLRRRLIGWLVKLIEDNQLATAPAQREQAAITLSRLGDPRKGVGLDPEYPLIPDIDWVEIPPGKVVLERNAGEFTIERPFQIARYPITNAQFQAFVDDPCGHVNLEWWRGFESQRREPDKSHWPEANHPKTEVS
ncbi:MAG: trypsin-like peptidase domain-containing protein, partial [Thiotrichales bacterium]